MSLTTVLLVPSWWTLAIRSRQVSDFDEESQVCRGRVGRVTAGVSLCDFKVPKRKETGRQEMDRRQNISLV
jgi:hypothetical protein